ncbi:MAG: glycosyltransferase [Candidatus Eisenbacteria bacterium]
MQVGADAASLPQAFDLFVLPSFIETMPLTVLEAMAGGTAVIASAVFGLPEMLRHGESGWLVPPGDTAALSGAIQRLGEDDALRGRIAAAGRARYEREFTARRMAQRTAAVYLDQDHSETAVGADERSDPGVAGDRGDRARAGAARLGSQEMARS